MAIFEINPLSDVRWKSFLIQHQRASVFHSSSWLDALHSTYGYLPILYTDSEPAAALHHALVFCKVESWITGRRLVSLPFSDHCEPLVDDSDTGRLFLSELMGQLVKGHWRYVEIRKRFAAELRSGPSFPPSEIFCFHELDLRPDLDALFRGFHKDSIQRKIRRAEKERLVVQEGASESNIETFYRLLLLARRRHGLPPQPKQWFRNLALCFGEDLTISTAFRNREPAAAILTLRFKNTLVYKYGCSDSRFHNSGAVQLLFWTAIQNAKRLGLELFDFGRSDLEAAGLIRFKDQWGARRSTLTYSRYPHKPLSEQTTRLKTRFVRPFLRRAPGPLLRFLGSVAYKHFA